MNGADFIALSPLIVLGATPVLVMLAIAIRRSHALAFGVATAGMLAAFGALWAAGALAPRQVTTLLLIDRYALFYIGLILFSTLVSTLTAYSYFASHEGEPEEFYVLIPMAALGCAVLVASANFVPFFLGLEILSVSLYGMIAYLKTREQPLEAGVKYLVLAAASSSFLLFGMALIYAALGTMEFAGIAQAAPSGLNQLLMVAGTTLILTGVGFKLALVPFHLWTPDVYQGAPAPVTAFIATASKTAMFALLLRYLYGTPFSRPLLIILTVIAIASMIVGNFLALQQVHVKRILAYSSIAHLGYVLVALLAGGVLAVEAVTFYLVAYSVTLLGAFGVVTLLSNAEGDADHLDDYRGLFWRRPVTGAVFTAALLSLAGIPATGGFIGKFFVIAAGAQAGRWLLVIVLIVTSAVGLFYYLRVLVVIYSTAPQPGAEFRGISIAGGAILALLALVLLWLGIYPQTLLETIRTAAAF